MYLRQLKQWSCRRNPGWEMMRSGRKREMASPAQMKHMAIGRKSSQPMHVGYAPLLPQASQKDPDLALPWRIQMLWERRPNKSICPNQIGPGEAAPTRSTPGKILSLASLILRALQFPRLVRRPEQLHDIPEDHTVVEWHEVVVDKQPDVDEAQGSEPHPRTALTKGSHALLQSCALQRLRRNGERRYYARGCYRGVQEELAARR
mmetsp:Transcript_44442/g.125795  ORF Transcript_44442/g.125795 Transcript_44442/m.125795 type:complete len:205 (-) Transcript_44442:351-965(-)